METYLTCNSTNNHLGKWTWYCNLCHKNMNVNSKTGHINSNFHKRRERFAFAVKTYEFNIPEINQIDNILKDITKDCKDKYFHTFHYRCEYDIKFEHASSDEVFYCKITNGSKLFLSQTERWF